jgi:hypothetical protein
MSTEQSILDTSDDERARARRRARARLAELDREWTPQRWEQATAEHDRRITEAEAA